MWIPISISLIGWLSGRRIISHWHHIGVLSDRQRINIFWLQISITILTLVLRKCGLFFLWTSTGLSVFATLLIPKLIEIRRKNEFYENLLPGLDSVLLLMRSGRSFRDSIQKISGPEAPHGHYFSEITRLIHGKNTNGIKSNDPLINRVYRELALIDQSSHRVIERLKSFRYVLKIEQNFRQKSRQALIQARAQSLILSTMYVGVAVFVAFEYGFKENAQAFGLSCGLFGIGTYWVWNLGRRHVWKV